MLEHDARADFLADRVPDRLAEAAGALRPLAVRFRVLRVGHRTPVGELVAIHDADRSVLHAEVALAVVGDHADGAAAGRARDLERHAAEPAGGAPHEDSVARLDDVRGPAHEHAIGGGGAQQEAARLFPREPRRLRQALVRLRARELAVAAVVGLVAPDARAFGE